MIKLIELSFPVLIFCIKEYHQNKVVSHSIEIQLEKDKKSIKFPFCLTVKKYYKFPFLIFWLFRLLIIYIIWV